MRNVLSAVTRYTDGSYSDANPGWHEEDSAWKAAHIAALLSGSEITPRTICEIGCGAGRILQCLSKVYPMATLAGYDISPQAIAMAKRHESESLKFYEMDLLSLDKLKFDIVIAADVFEHVEDYLGFLRKLIAYGTLFVFHIPLDLSAIWVMQEWRILRRRTRVGHIHHFTRATALETLRDTGYFIEKWQLTGSGFVEPRSIKNRMRHMPIEILAKVAPIWTANFFGGFSLLVLACSESANRKLR